MRKLKVGVAIGAFVLFAGACLADEYEQLMVGRLYLGGTRITATAAQINKLGGNTLYVTNATVEAQTVTISNVTGVASATFTPTLFTNTFVYLADTNGTLVTNSYVYVSGGSIAVTLTMAPVAVETNTTIAIQR